MRLGARIFSEVSKNFECEMAYGNGREERNRTLHTLRLNLKKNREQFTDPLRERMLDLLQKRRYRRLCSSCSCVSVA